jgi:hypothetical protein
MRIGLLFVLFSCVSGLEVLFWNLRTFGIHRASSANGQQLYAIANTSDIIFFAEVKDSDCNLDNPITCPLKTFFQSYFPDHSIILSPPLHYCDEKHSGSEIYAILIRKDLKYQMVSYPDSECLFIRRPYGIKIEDKTYLTFHSNPGNEKELVFLDKVFQYFDNQNTLIIGDFNTGCHYVQFKTLENFPIGNNYVWKLAENAFTNLERSCPYDRIVTTLDFSDNVYNARVLNHNKEAERIKSDHYPIAVSVY